MPSGTLSDFIGPLGVSCCLLSAVSLFAAERPNILLVVTDDQSWTTAGAYGDKVARTPNFDRIARNGALFEHAYCSTPSCTPSRASLLTGRPFSTLGEGANLLSSLPAEYPVFPELLEEAGYAIGHTGKGWGPGDIYAAGRSKDPLGAWYMNGAAQDKRSDEAKLFHAPQNWSANFEAFLDSAPKDRPFFFWFGSNDPHRPYQEALGENVDRDAVNVPPFLPDHPVVRQDLAEYVARVERADRDFGSLLNVLEQRGLIENTLIIFTSDNGMPFPRCKGFLYDYGVRMPLAVQWPARIPGGRAIDDFVSLADLAPTILEAAGVTKPPEMLGHGFLSALSSHKVGRVDSSRDKAFFGRERHSGSRVQDGRAVGYPMRGVRTDQFLYIRNFEPSRIPASSGGPVIDTDAGPTRTFLDEHKDDPQFARLWQLCFGKRPTEELYNVKGDPFEIRNIADDPRMAKTLSELRNVLDGWMKDIGDPRFSGEGGLFDRFPVRKSPNK